MDLLKTSVATVFICGCLLTHPLKKNYGGYTAPPVIVAGGLPSLVLVVLVVNDSEYNQSARQ